MDWQRALSSAEAHSTLSVETNSSSHGQDAVSLRHVHSPIHHRLEEDRRGQLLELERQGVVGAPACLHRRRLFLSVDGDDLRGDDALIPEAGGDAPKWVLRFHLYPTIKASLSRDGQSVIMSTAQNEGWRFVAKDAHIALKPSIYCGQYGKFQKTEQIVVTPNSRQGALRQVKWALKKS